MKSAHVLLVDDSEDVLQSLSTTLLSAGFQVTTANNGEEALASLENGHPQLIISDVMMPKMTGYELCREVRSRGFEDIPFLLMSALGSQPDRIIGLRLGADDYLVKPIDPQELLLRIHNQISKNETRERRFLCNLIHRGGKYLSVLNAAMVAAPALAEKTARILSLVEIHHSLRGVLDASPFADIDTLRIIYALLQIGVLRVGPDQERVPEA